jgi:hypothetical protein
MKKFNGYWICSYKSKNFFFEYSISDFDMIYMHILIWVGFGLWGYVPNTLYTYYLRILTLFWGRRIWDFFKHIFIRTIGHNSLPIAVKISRLLRHP